MKNYKFTSPSSTTTQTHLEAQTDLIVQSIQALLKTMRNSEIFGSELTDIVADITSIVQSLVYSSKQSLGLPTASRIHNDGHLILQDLEYSAQMLETLGASLIIDPSSKSLKQKVATSSYEIAKVRIRDRENGGMKQISQYPPHPFPFFSL